MFLCTLSVLLSPPAVACRAHARTHVRKHTHTHRDKGTPKTMPETQRICTLYTPAGCFSTATTNQLHMRATCMALLTYRMSQYDPNNSTTRDDSRNFLKIHNHRSIAEHSTT
eukprot:6339156-Amphidinium_carterae.1